MSTSTIIFDSECNLCNGIVGWLLKYVPKNTFHIVAFQSKLGQQLLYKNGFPTERLETVILIDNDGVMTYSDGFLKIMSNLPHFKFVASILKLIPRFVRDAIYWLISKNRVNWFGKSDSCSIFL